MPNNNNAGMHFIHFPSERSALHEFDYDNQVGSSIRKKTETIKKQTSMWSADGNPVDLKASIRQYQKEKREFAKKQEEEKKRQESKKIAKQNSPGMHFVEFSSGNPDFNAGSHSAKDTRNRTEVKKKQQGTKSSKQSIHKKEEVNISPNALGNDPRFKELFASLKD